MAWQKCAIFKLSGGSLKRRGERQLWKSEWSINIAFFSSRSAGFYRREVQGYHRALPSIAELDFHFMFHGEPDQSRIPCVSYDIDCKAVSDIMSSRPNLKKLYTGKNPWNVVFILIGLRIVFAFPKALACNERFCQYGKVYLCAQKKIILLKVDLVIAYFQGRAKFHKVRST